MSLFVDLARADPLVIMVEDLHRFDGATLELFPYLARRLTRQARPVGWDLRTDELHRLHPFKASLTDLRRGRLEERIELGPPGSRADRRDDPLCCCA